MTPRVLVVEDHATNLKLVRWVLSTEGFAVADARSAEEALETLQHERPDLLLVDIALPGIDGLELTRRLRANPWTADLPIVAMTAFAMKGDAERAYAAGCDAYITKPIDTRALPRQLRSMLRPSHRT